MKNGTLYPLATFVALAALLVTPSSAEAQARLASNSSNASSGTYGRLTVMNASLDEAQQVLAMAYRDNLVIFTKVLRGKVGNASPVNKDVSGPAMDEMRRSFEKLSDAQKEQAKSMNNGTISDSALAVLKNRMDAQLTELDNHLDALEKELKESSPDPRLISQHSSEVLKQAGGLWVLDSKRGSKGTPRR